MKASAKVRMHRAFIPHPTHNSSPMCHFVGLKVLNEWPTFPQLIVKGELVGGLDIVKEMVANDEFDDVVNVD
jgi:hypothetical protein